MRIPKELLKATAFLGGKDGQKQLHYRATAFLVGMPSTRIESGWPCLVTAKHNIVKAMEAYGNVYVRLNTEDGGAKDIAIKEPWAFADAPSCDIAVVPFPTVLETNAELFPFSARAWFVTQEVIESRGIGPGDDLVVMGLFSNHVGKERNLPIVRSGNIASMPFEPLIDPKTLGPYDAYLAEVRSVGGLSGSPVLVVLDPNPRPIDLDKMFDQGGRRFYLLGLIRGHWKRDAETDFGEEDFNEAELGQLNTGVAIVTPITELLPVFESERFVTYAQAMEKRYDEEVASGQVEDSAMEADSDEFENFEDLTRKLVHTPKPKD